MVVLCASAGEVYRQDNHVHLEVGQDLADLVGASSAELAMSYKEPEDQPGSHNRGPRVHNQAHSRRRRTYHLERRAQEPRREKARIAS